MARTLTQEQRVWLQGVYERAMRDGEDTIYHAEVPESFYEEGDEGYA